MEAPNHGDWCVYAKAWVSVKAKWHLTVTAAEKAALASMLFGCLLVATMGRCTTT